MIRNEKKPQPTQTTLSQLLEEISPLEQARTDKKMILASLIARAIKAKNWTGKQFAAEMGQQPSVISKWLSGTHNFTIDSLSDIEEKLGIQLLNRITHESSLSVNSEYRIAITGQTVLREGIIHYGMANPPEGKSKTKKKHS